MIKKFTFYLFLAFCLLLVLPSFGQSRKKKPKNLFGAGVIIGLNAAQLDGDHTAGFKRKGIYSGVRGIVHFSLQRRLNIELVFSQKGSIWDERARNFGPLVKGDIKVDYMEVPVILKSFWNEDSDGLFWEMGFSFARIINLKIEENLQESTSINSYTLIEDDFKSNEFSAIGGLGFQLKHNISFGFRFTIGVTKMYDYQDGDVEITSIIGDRPVVQLRNYHISIYSAYEF